jgi:hypothetical protein
MHIGAHSQTGVTQQTAGTVFVYGWKIVILGSNSTFLSNLAVNGIVTGNAVNALNNVGCASLSCTGGISCKSLTVNSVALPIAPAYMRASINSTSGVFSALSQTNITWVAAANSGITLVTSPGTEISCPAIGTYLFAGKLNVSSAITASCTVVLNTSTNGGSTYSNLQQNQYSSLPVGGEFILATFIVATTVVNQRFQLYFSNGHSSSFTVNTTPFVTHLCITRIA